MGEMIATAPCRFCGQMNQVEEGLTKPQAEEQATMTCMCEEALEYQQKKARKENAKMTLNLTGGTKATISRNSKGEISVERMETKKQKLTE